MTKDGAPGSQKATASSGSAELDKKLIYRKYLEGLEARFVQRCEVELCLDEKTSSQALQFFKQSKPLLVSTLGTIGTGTVEETERTWHACVLFAVKKLSNRTSAGDDNVEDNVVGFTLSQILKATKRSVLEFFKELPQFLTKMAPHLGNTYGDDWEKRLMVKEVQADFYYLTVLFNYYKRVYQNLFLPTEGASGTTSGLSLGGEIASVHMRFGWMLFLVLRMRVLSQFADLVTYINGLLAVVVREFLTLIPLFCFALAARGCAFIVGLHEGTLWQRDGGVLAGQSMSYWSWIIMILHMPPALRKFSFDCEDLFKKRAADGSVKIVASLCALYHDASEEDVSRMVEKVSSIIGDLFKKTSSLRTRNRAEQLSGIDTDNLVYYEDLMDERSITSNLRTVEKVYEEAYHSHGELDERMFINGDKNLIGAVSSGTPTSSGSKRRFDCMSSPNQIATGSTVSTGANPSPPSSPSLSSPKSSSIATNSRMPPPTPVTETMSTVKWLRTYISPLPSEPTPELQIYLSACNSDVSSNVTYRAQVLMEKIFAMDGASKSQEGRGTRLLGSTWAEQRRLEASKLYYRVLSAMCRAESQRLGNKNLTALLTNERFHRCMIACSAELVLYTHKTVTMTFPAVLKPTGITAFDLSKLIESFVRHEEQLPRELKRHLNSMEQQILESMVWEKGSSMYNNLIVAKKHLAPIINRLGLLADPMPALDTLTQHPVELSGNLRHEPEDKVEDPGPSSPKKVPTAFLSIVKAVPKVADEAKDQAGNILFASRKRPSAFSTFTSPVKSRPQPPLQSAFASPQRPSPLGGGETCAEPVISVFFRKVLKLAAVRIKDLCERLHQSNHVLEQVYRTMRHLLEKETSLFFNRHIDQLILCSVYGVCKVNKANVTFKTCIEHYGKQPQCKRHVFCSVILNFLPVTGEGKTRGPETGDIITFYNQIFVPATKQYLVHLGEGVQAVAPISSRPKDGDENDKDGSMPGSPRPSFPALPDMSPKKVSASHNVYVSPLRSTKGKSNQKRLHEGFRDCWLSFQQYFPVIPDPLRVLDSEILNITLCKWLILRCAPSHSKMDTPISPHTRSLFACVGESTHAFQSPSRDLTAINNRLNNRRLGRLDFNGPSLVSDAVVAGSLYPGTRSGNHHSARLTTDSVLSVQSQPSWAINMPLPPSPLKRPCSEM